MTQVLCGAWDENDIEGPKIKGLEAIVGHNICSISYTEPALDLKIVFDNEMVLRVFCDATNSYDENDNYSLFFQHEILIVGNKSVIRKEERSSL